MINYLFRPQIILTDVSACCVGEMKQLAQTHSYNNHSYCIVSQDMNPNDYHPALQSLVSWSVQRSNKTGSNHPRILQTQTASFRTE